jgi:hypothetical protein
MVDDEAEPLANGSTGDVLKALRWDQRRDQSASDREASLITGVNGPIMAPTG